MASDNFSNPIRTAAARTAAIALAVGSALILTACAGPASAGEARSGALRVVATTTQLTDFSARVGGEDIDLTGLLPAGGSAHHFDPSPADLLALSQADVLVVNGVGLESFLEDAIEASGFDGKVVTASDGIDLAGAQEITAEGEREAGSAGNSAESDEHDHDADDHDADDDHGEINPHIWTSPRNAEGMVSEIARGLGKADPARFANYRDRADSYIAELKELDAWITAQFERVPAADRVLVSGHDSLRYYLHDYGIAFAGALLPSFEDNAEPSAAEIDALVRKIRSSGVKAVFVESMMNPKLARTVAAEAGVKALDADSLYADSLGAPGSPADSYLAATVNNTRVILEAWGVTPDPLPEGLEQ